MFLTIAQKVVTLLCVTFFIVCGASFNPSMAQDVKRGWAGMDATQANAVNARWSYNWGYVPQPGLHGEYVPMFWGPFNVQLRLDAILTYPDVQYVLGFNEPERPDQANMSVETAIEFWTDICEGLEGTGIKLVSPAVSDTIDGRAWLAEFIQQVEANNLVVDEIAFHWYGFVNPANPTASANSFLNKVDQYYNDYGRNVWVTEFAGVDFAGQFTDEQMQQANATFMSVAIPGLESREYVTRYSMWAFNDDCRPIVLDDCGQWRPTIVGENYFPITESGETVVLNGSTNSTDTVYLRGGKIENNGSQNQSAIKDIYTMSNPDGTLLASSLGGMSDWGTTDAASIVVEENATLRKIDSNQVSWLNAAICNFGLIRLFESGSGTLWIQGPETTAIGDGEFRLDAGSTLQLGNKSDEQGFSLPFGVQCRGGVVQVDGQGIQLDGSLQVFLQTQFDVSGSLVINGSIDAPPAGGGSGIVKNGAGSLTLIGPHTFNGTTIINEGTLSLNGAIDNSVILNSGELRGVGNVGGSLTVGGTLSPGNNVGVFQSNFCEFLSGSTLAVDLGSAGANDKLVVNGPLIIEQDSRLVCSLTGDFIPEIGDTFDIVDAQTISGGFDQLELPILEDGQWNLDLFEIAGIIRVVELDLLLGDVNLDGFVNLLDVAPFIQHISDGNFQSQADVNQDGVVNLLDVTPFVKLLSGQ